MNFMLAGILYIAHGVLVKRNFKKVFMSKLRRLPLLHEPVRNAEKIDGSPLHPRLLFVSPGDNCWGRFMIPEHVIQQIAAANDIVDVIAGYFPLKKAGPAYKALCPFHREKSPSFTVNPARQIFKCFGCGAGGGVFKFVEMYENVNFPEAVKRLGARVNIRVEDEPLSEEENAQQLLRRKLLALHATTADWFHTNLLRTKAGQGARDYLKGRGITAEVAKSWKLGYAPDAWDALSHWAKGNGYRDDEIIASGLVTFKEDEESGRPTHYYDRFRDRLMFPICNDIGEVIAFSGRVLNPEAFGGKYVNSPETPLFVKGNVLFGIHKTKRAIIDKSSAIVCEGQLDLITAYEAGVQNVIAPQGTAFTDRQAHILKRFANEVVLCFDSDAAGLKAAERSLPALLDAGLSVRVAEMPSGHDPDSYIRSEGGEAFARQIASARDFFDFQIERSAAMEEFATPKGKALFARKMAESVALITDPILRQATVNNVSSRLEMPAKDFAILLKRTGTKPRPGPPGREPEPQEEKPAVPTMSVTTRLLCQLALLSPAARDWLLQHPWQALFSREPEAEILVRVLEGRFEAGEPASIATFLSTLPAEEQNALADLLNLKRLPEYPIHVVADCWRDMERRQMEQQLGAVEARLRKPGLKDEEVDALQKAVVELGQRLRGRS